MSPRFKQRRCSRHGVPLAAGDQHRGTQTCGGRMGNRQRARPAGSAHNTAGLWRNNTCRAPTNCAQWSDSP